MACFIVPATEAVITTVATKILKKKGSESSIRFAGKLNKLNGLLWGGSGLLAFEHLWHGEITPFFPFLTAASDPSETAAMIHEMATSGTSMALLVTAVWAGMVLVTNKLSASQMLPREKAGAES